MKYNKATPVQTAWLSACELNTSPEIALPKQQFFNRNWSSMREKLLWETGHWSRHMGDTV